MRGLPVLQGAAQMPRPWEAPPRQPGSLLQARPSLCLLLGQGLRQQWTVARRAPLRLGEARGGLHCGPHSQLFGLCFLHTRTFESPQHRQNPGMDRSMRGRTAARPLSPRGSERGICGRHALLQAALSPPSLSACSGSWPLHAVGTRAALQDTLGWVCLSIPGDEILGGQGQQWVRLRSAGVLAGGVKSHLDCLW